MAAPAGITGMTGLQGLRGLQGPPRYAFQGPPFGYTTARLTTSTPTGGGNAVYLTPQNLGTWYNITSSLFAGNNSALSIYLPFYNPTFSTAPPVALSSSSWGGYDIIETNYTLIITTSAPHKLRLQSLVTLAGMTFNDTVNGTYRVQRVGSATQFTVYTSTQGPGNNSDETGTVTESTAVETTNEAFPAPEHAGNFWLFKNNDSRNRTVNFLNEPVTYEGDDEITTLELAKGQKMTVLYTGSNFIVL
jgi:hypothetical protein